MELSQIKYFLNLAETRNFTEAARRSGIAQPSLTKSIRRLEDELGAPLVYRDGKDTRLTALGREVQMEFMHIDGKVDAVRELAEISIAGDRRALTLGVAPTISPLTLSNFLGHVLEQLPSVEITVHQMQPGESESEVLSGKYDMCVMTNAPEQDFKLVTVPLFSEHLKFALSQGHALAGQKTLTPAQIEQETYIDRLHCEFRSQLVEHFMDRNIVMRPRLQSEREDWVQQMVAEGLGICALPERSGVVQGLALRPVEGLNLLRNVTLVAVSGSGNAKEVRQILALARDFDWSALPLFHGV